MGGRGFVCWKCVCACVLCVCVREREREREKENEREIINTRNSIPYDIRLSVYSDGMGPVEVERRIVIVEENKCTERI